MIEGKSVSNFLIMEIVDIEHVALIKKYILILCKY